MLTIIPHWLESVLDFEGCWDVRRAIWILQLLDQDCIVYLKNSSQNAGNQVAHIKDVEGLKVANLCYC